MAIKPLSAGRYYITCKEASLIAAAANGHSTVWPEAEAVSDGARVVFTREGKDVYTCNATYAAHHFNVTRIPT